MSLRDFSWRRSISSYARVRALVSRCRRNRAWQLRSPRLADTRYLDIGCGPNTHPAFINLDYMWYPGVDVCWDISRGLPFATGSLHGIFSEHCLEHFSLPAVRVLLQECRRVLRAGAIVRIVVPDAQQYLDLYSRRMAGEQTEDFPYEDAVRQMGLTSPLLSVNRAYYVDRDLPAGHRCMFDYALLSELVSMAGFADVRREAYGTGRDATLLIDSEHRRVESLYLEAVRPSGDAPPQRRNDSGPIGR